MTTAPPQSLLRTVGGVRLRLVSVQPELAETITFDAQLIAGGEVLPTTTCCWQLLLLPLTSTTVQVTKVVPTG